MGYLMNAATILMMLIFMTFFVILLHQYHSDAYHRFLKYKFKDGLWTDECSLNELKRKFCSIDFIILVKLNKSEQQGELILYSLENFELIDGPENMQNHFKERNYVIQMDRSANTTLQLDHKYLLAGRLIATRLVIAKCDLLIDWTSLTDEAKQRYMTIHKSLFYC
ncbi:hypothetical protein B4U79_18935 [Dinothrombium tinctorium]|uniref:NTR domain-containing protein n=1 Tax=Dinothrombium tinctorium TaxID=1965070 RepID=A0A3S3PQ78_9ACAR|nr:hypothetical protein B4U79_18935 [Dinothrombium tinctorium]